jgi:5-methylcytosine-specific restriction endonuclease McrA
MRSVLVLNASYEYLNVTSLERAVTLLFKDKAELVEAVDGLEISSVRVRMRLPSVIRMRYYIQRPYKEVPLTRKNVLLRDRHTCQYCGRPGDTVDHVRPRSRGGPHTWENCVCACAECNRRKNDRTPEEARMALRRKPRRPLHLPWLLISDDKSRQGWARYLYGSTA